jgi:hypothetical protein
MSNAMILATTNRIQQPRLAMIHQVIVAQIHRTNPGPSQASDAAFVETMMRPHLLNRRRLGNQRTFQVGEDEVRASKDFEKTIEHPVNFPGAEQRKGLPTRVQISTDDNANGHDD